MALCSCHSSPLQHESTTTDGLGMQNELAQDVAAMTFDFEATTLEQEAFLKRHNPKLRWKRRRSAESGEEGVPEQLFRSRVARGGTVVCYAAPVCSAAVLSYHSIVCINLSWQLERRLIKLDS
jgi:hypothetical protein